MVWTMSSTEEKSIPLEAVISEPRREMESVGRKSTKRYLIAGVVSVVIVVIIIIAILVGMYIFTDSFHKIMQETMRPTKDSTQETKVDLTSNIAEYTVKQADGEAKFVDDYNSYLKVIKFDFNDGVTCYVTPINVSSKVDLTQFNKTPENGAVEKIVLVKSKMPIPDLSFLNKKARNMCQGITTYWAYRHCDKSQEANSVQKRCFSVCFGTDFLVRIKWCPWGKEC